jgi:signal transduction histidine kinase
MLNLKRLFLIVIFCCTTNLLFAQQKAIDSLLKKLQKVQPDTTRLADLSHLASAYMSVNPEMTYKYALLLKKLAEKTHLLKWKADAYNDLGISWGIRSKYDSALYYFNVSLRQAEAIKYDIGIANAYINMGQVFERLGNNVKASAYYLKALPLFEHSKHDYGINFCLANLGDIYAAQKSYKIALYYYNRSLAGYKASKKQGREAFLLSNIASCYYEMNLFENSLKYYKLSFNIREKTGDLAGLADVYSGMGEIYTSLKNYGKALDFLFKAEGLLKKVKDQSYLARVYGQVADNYLQQKQLRTAETFALKSLLIARQIKSVTKTADALNILSKINNAGKNFEAAYNYQSQYLLYRDSIFNEDKLKQISLASLETSQTENSLLNKDNQLKTAQLAKNKLEIKFFGIILILCVLITMLVALLAIFLYRSNRDKKTTNDLLEKQKSEISEINHELRTMNDKLTSQIEVTVAQNKELERLNDMKSKLYAVVSHDFRSPLSILKSLIDLSQAGDITGEEMQTYLKQVSITVDQTFIFLENLLIWSKNQMQGINLEPEEFDIRTIILENTDLFAIQAEMKGIALYNKVLQPVMVFADMATTRLVVRNLLANAIKFTGKGGSVTFNASQEPGRVTVSIADTGTGMGKEVLGKLFHSNYTSLGTASEKGSGLGLMMCNEFINYNKGRIRAESEPGKGSTFYFTLPIK